MNNYDVIVVGAGVSGAFISRELSKYNLKVAVLESHNDVGDGCSSANSAIIHSGYDPLPGTNKAKFNVLGNPMWSKLSEDLDFHLYRTGSLTLAYNQEQLKSLEELKARAELNGVEVFIIDRDELLKMEPNVNKNAVGALYAPTAGVVDPFNAVVKAMENAVDNGVELFLNNKVENIVKDGNLYKISTNKDVFYSKIVINAAGAHSDVIARMIEDIDWNITPRKGEYYLLDHYAYGLVNHTIFTLPTEKGKGVLVSFTSSGNYILGPSSEPVDDPDDVSTDNETLSKVKVSAFDIVPNIPMAQSIRVFSGVRPTCSRHDFVIEYSKKDKHFINVAGIESPGFVSAPAIAEYVVNELVKPIIPLYNKDNFNPKVRKHPVLFDMKPEERMEFVKNNPDYGTIICNCEKISLGEIKDALNRNVAPHSVKALKKRVRAGMGKCQGGFCSNKVLMLLAKHYNLSFTDVLYSDEGSSIVKSIIKEGK